MKASMLLATLVGAFGLGKNPSSHSKRESVKLPTAKVNKQNAAKSQRAMRTEQGIRPHQAVGARKIARRATHAIKGTPCNS